MLDPLITQHVEETMRLKAGDFDRGIRHSLAETVGGSYKDVAAAANASIRAAARQRQIFSEELDRRGQYVFEEIKRALKLYPQSFDDILGSWLAGLHFTETRKQCTELQRLQAEPTDRQDTPIIKLPRSLMPPTQLSIANMLNEQCDQLCALIANEIRVHVRSLRQQPAAPAPTSTIINNIHGTHIGSVQTGPNSSAHVTMNVGSSDREALLAALELIASALHNAQELADARRTELIDVIAQARTVAHQPAPNPSLLRGMFLVLCETLQTIAAARPATDALRAAALPFGINL